MRSTSGKSCLRFRGGEASKSRLRGQLFSSISSKRQRLALVAKQRLERRRGHRITGLLLHCTEPAVARRPHGHQGGSSLPAGSIFGSASDPATSRRRSPCPPRFDLPQCGRRDLNPHFPPRDFKSLTQPFHPVACPFNPLWKVSISLALSISKEFITFHGATFNCIVFVAPMLPDGWGLIWQRRI